jgi:hypothetical protein
MCKCSVEALMPYTVLKIGFWQIPQIILDLQTKWHCHVSRVSVYFCFLQRSLWLNSSRGIGCMDSCLMDITPLQNVLQKENCSSRNAELNESYKYGPNDNKNLMIYCFWNFFMSLQLPRGMHNSSCSTVFDAYFWRIAFVILYIFFIHIHKTCEQK